MVHFLCLSGIPRSLLRGVFKFHRLIAGSSMAAQALVAALLFIPTAALGESGRPVEASPSNSPGSTTTPGPSLTDDSMFTTLPSPRKPEWGRNPFIPAALETTPPEVPPPSPPPPDPRTGLELTAILTGEGGGKAVINGGIFTVGETVGLGKIRRIEPRGVILKYDGKEYLLTLRSLTGSGDLEPRWTQKP